MLCVGGGEKFTSLEAAPPQKFQAFKGGGDLFENFEPLEALPQKFRAFRGVTFFRVSNLRRQRRHRSSGLLRGVRGANMRGNKNQFSE